MWSNGANNRKWRRVVKHLSSQKRKNEKDKLFNHRDMAYPFTRTLLYIKIIYDMYIWRCTLYIYTPPNAQCSVTQVQPLLPYIA
jgi:hypothetical protein